VSVLLRARGLGKRFGGLPAVVDVDLDVDAREVLALIGPNGAGKSTVLGLLSGTIAPTSVGSIRLDGVELTGCAPHRIRRHGMATVQQTPRLFPRLSVLDNVMVGALFGTDTPPPVAGAEQHARSALEFVGLGAHVAAPADRLSLHERRSLDLARALTGGTRVLLLDEVMAGLNPAEVDLHTELLRRIRDEQGIALVWVEHVMRAVTALADRIVVLERGQVIATGTPDEVVHDPLVAEAYLGRQGGGRAPG
jgi:branched-chain amino acid transport system permease protein